jgi:hypothetical protein
MKTTLRLLLACFALSFAKGAEAATSFTFSGIATQRAAGGSSDRIKQSYIIATNLTAPKTIRVISTYTNHSTSTEIYYFKGGGKLVHDFLSGSTVTTSQKGTYKLKRAGANTVITTSIIEKIGKDTDKYAGSFTISKTQLKVTIVEAYTGGSNTLTFVGKK